MVTTHCSNYQKRDFEVVDYHMYQLPGTNLSFRGPSPSALGAGKYIVCIGAAQTFGCFCQEPYPELLKKRINAPVLNLGYGGAGPRFFARHEKLQPYISKARLAIVQVMSARSVSNRIFEAGGHEYLTVRKTGERVGAEEAWRRLLMVKIPSISCRLPWPLSSIVTRSARYLAFYSLRSLVAETRRNWIRDYCELLDGLSIPTILLWFSRRSPAYRETYTDIGSLFGDFPQLVTESMVAKIAGRADHYVECVSSRGTPHVLRSRFTGKPVAVDPADDRPDLGGYLITQDSYYPSPEMHRDACDMLAGCLRKYL